MFHQTKKQKSFKKKNKYSLIFDQLPATPSLFQMRLFNVPYFKVFCCLFKLYVLGSVDIAMLTNMENKIVVTSFYSWQTIKSTLCCSSSSKFSHSEHNCKVQSINYSCKRVGNIFSQ